jgi:prepilin-type N-terminal cleavage/methylation domain-containing protein
MENKISSLKCQSSIYSRRGFTLVEVLVGSVIILLVVLAALSLYVQSNKLSVDQMQFASLQHEVRSAMFFLSRDIRSTGVGLIPEIAGYFVEGTDGYGPSPESADSIKLMANFDNPLKLRIESYMGGAGGGAATASLYDGELNNNPYTTVESYVDRPIFLMSTACPGCFALRQITNVFGLGVPGDERITMSPGLSELDPPGGLLDTGCAANCWDDALITFAQIKQYWLDTTGNPGDYPDLNLAVGQDGYLGIPYTLYSTNIDESGNTQHMALALNIENLQFQYIGDFDYDELTDTPSNWDNSNWTINPMDDEATKQAKIDLIRRIRMVRIWVLGRTENPFVSVSGAPSSGINVYRRPAIANSPASSQDNLYRRFLLETTANIRNLSLNIYNTGNVY